MMIGFVCVNFFWLFGFVRRCSPLLRGANPYLSLDILILSAAFAYDLILVHASPASAEMWSVAFAFVLACS